VTILAFADVQQQPAVFSRLLDHTWNQADYLLGVGDYVQDGCPQRCDQWWPFVATFAGRDFGRLKDIALSRGNHDGGYWQMFGWPLFGGSWFMRTWGPVCIVVLDSGEEVPIRYSLLGGGAQREWLRVATRSAAWTGARWRVAAFHHPDRVDHWAGCYYQPRQEIEETMALLLDAGVDLILHGHSHAYARRRLRTGALQVICGGGGGYLDTQRCWTWPETQVALAVHHVVLVEASETSLRVKAIGTNGAVIDEVVR
jgi:hypothetical protein